MLPEEAARCLAEHIRSLPDFVYHEVGDSYGHIGATIADAVLQPQRDYDTFVAPRTKRILANWPRDGTVTAMLSLLRSLPASEFLNYEDTEGSDSWLAHRVRRFCTVLNLLNREGIESEADLKAWLTIDSNLPMLYAVNGVGPKTVDYLKILVGVQGAGAAVDSRLRGFLGMSGIVTAPSDYDTQREIINRAADILSVDRSVLDHSIWMYMGNGDAAKIKCT
jgi:hypothetical protein